MESLFYYGSQFASCTRKSDFSPGIDRYNSRSGREWSCWGREFAEQSIGTAVSVWTTYTGLRADAYGGMQLAKFEYGFAAKRFGLRAIATAERHLLSRLQ